VEEREFQDFFYPESVDQNVSDWKVFELLSTYNVVW
jgi:hypothetical protein